MINFAFTEVVSLECLAGDWRVCVTHREGDWMFVWTVGQAHARYVDQRLQQLSMWPLHGLSELYQVTVARY